MEKQFRIVIWQIDTTSNFNDAKELVEVWEVPQSKLYATRKEVVKIFDMLKEEALEGIDYRIEETEIKDSSLWQ